MKPPLNTPCRRADVILTGETKMGSSFWRFAWMLVSVVLICMGAGILLNLIFIGFGYGVGEYNSTVVRATLGLGGDLLIALGVIGIRYARHLKQY